MLNKQNLKHVEKKIKLKVQEKVEKEKFIEFKKEGLIQKELEEKLLIKIL